MSDALIAEPREAGPRQTFAGEADRRRLTPPALKALVRLTAAWHLTKEQAAALVGVSPSTWDRIRQDRWQQTLTRTSSCGRPR